jgi:beta-glucosidase
MPFPADFAWGTATSSYQIEGAVDEDGRGPSIWDTFSHTPGRVANDDTGDIACDHYHRWAEDVDLIASYGLTAYRFSIAWPRIQPTGRGKPNQRGIDFYDRLVDRLLEKGSRPMATLYHWDLPQALQDEGDGWQNREIVDRFGEYASVMYDALGDRVAWWITHNEPWVAAAVGHRIGRHAPGLHDLEAELRVAHHLLLAHGRAVEAYRGSALAAPIGITLNLYPTYPERHTDEDGAAARLADAYANRWYLDPVLRGSYPANLLDWLATRHAMDWVRDGDLERVRQPIDFLGVNYYSRSVVRAPHDGEVAEFPWVGSSEISTDVARTDLGWEITPFGLTDLLLRLDADYGSPPMLITENGAAFNDGPSADGEIHDARRVEFMRSHLAALETAIDRGVDVRGYFAWSLMDNFEWGEGYSMRFGITYVDYATLQRTPKDSARWFAEVARRNGLA